MNKKNLLKYGGGLLIFAMWAWAFGVAFGNVWVGLLCATALFALEHFVRKALNNVKTEE